LTTALALAAVLLPCRAHAAPSPEAEGWIPFEANWSAGGHINTLRMGSREASTFDLSGPFLVTTGQGLATGFRAQAIGFVERDVLGIGRMVLTDERGDQIFNDLRGQAPGTGKEVRGTITGGTGRYADLQGSFVFDWQYVLRTEEGAIQGRAVGLKGRYRRKPAAGAPTPSGTPE
jgi:hypothetical protein